MLGERGISLNAIDIEFFLFITLFFCRNVGFVLSESQRPGCHLKQRAQTCVIDRLSRCIFLLIYLRDQLKSNLDALQLQIFLFDPELREISV